MEKFEKRDSFKAAWSCILSSDTFIYKAISIVEMAFLFVMQTGN